MDTLTIAGLLLGIGGILVGQILEGGHLSTLVNLPAAFIVLGGTSGAVMLQSPLAVFIHSLHLLPWIFRSPPGPQRAMVAMLMKWGAAVRKGGLLGLENASDSERDPFVKKGLQLLVDGVEPGLIRSILELDMDLREERDLRAAKVFESMGGYSPTIGILGAVLGLIHVMNNLANPGTLGPGIATSFVATIYGVGCANLLFLPIANKLKSVVRTQTEARQMVVEGLIGIAEGTNLRVIEIKLMGYIIE
ncbi:chemotaxis protein MotA [Gammaproteobacteria bacterium]